MATKRKAGEAEDFQPNKKPYEPDPLNLSINCYREQALTWEEIATKVNDEYGLGRGTRIPTLSTEACRQRFKANKVKIDIWRGIGSDGRRSRVPGPPTTRVKLSPAINEQIYGLRTEQHAGWGDIASVINTDFGFDNSCREKRPMSGNACRQRFSASAFDVARDRGDDFEMKWYVGSSHGRIPSVRSSSEVSADSNLDASLSASDPRCGSRRSIRLSNPVGDADCVNDDEEVKESCSQDVEKDLRLSEDSPEAMINHDRDIMELAHACRNGTNPQAQIITVKVEDQENEALETVGQDRPPASRNKGSTYTGLLRELSVNEQIVLKAVRKAEPRFWQEVAMMVNVLAEEGEEMSSEEVKAVWHKIQV